MKDNFDYENLIKALKAKKIPLMRVMPLLRSAARLRLADEGPPRIADADRGRGSTP